MTESRVALLVKLCSAALLAPLAVPLLTGRVFVTDDLAFYHLPIRHLFQQALNAGDTTLWTPAIFSGLYLHGEGQAGIFHPFHQFLYRAFPLGAALNVELIASYPAAFGGTLWLLRRLGLGRAAALTGAMLFAFSGFNLLHHMHINMVAVVAHLPWLLAGADVLITDERRRARTLAVAGIAICLASAILLGFPQAVLWDGMALTAFGLFRAAQTGRWRRLAPLTAAVALGTLLGGVQLLPTLAAAADSTRMQESSEFALTYSLHPFNIIQLWSPMFFAKGAFSDRGFMLFHEYGIYSGAVLPLAVIWVWIRRDALAQRRALIVAATGFAALGLVLALGEHGGVAVLFTYVPGLQTLRAPVRYILFFQYALAILAAVMLDDLLAIAEGRSEPPPARSLAALWIPAALGIVTTLVLSSGVFGYGRHTFASAPVASIGVAIVTVVTMLVYLAGRRARWAIGMLVVMTAVDLAVWGIGFIYRRPLQTIEGLTQAIPPAPDAPAASYATAPERGPYKDDLLVLKGYRLTNGYVGLFPAGRHPLDGVLAMRLAGTRWVFTNGGARLPVEGSAERVRLLDDQGQASGRARLLVDRPGHLVAEVEAHGPSTLELTERFHEGWSATIDGTAGSTLRVEEDFLGCRVEAGAHRVTFRFMPRSFVYGSIVSAIGLVLLAGVLLGGAREPARSPR